MPIKESIRVTIPIVMAAIAKALPFCSLFDLSSFKATNPKTTAKELVNILINGTQKNRESINDENA